jgi:hypothetical protein
VAFRDRSSRLTKWLNIVCHQEFYPVLRVGHLLSILAMIRSAIVIASAIADSNIGEGRPSQFDNFRTARMLAAMSSTRFRGSSTKEGYNVRLYFAS